MTMLSRNDIGHWQYSYRFDPTQWFGFLYVIENDVTGQFYIGKKQFFHKGKKRSKTYGKEMTWRTYIGSSTHLKADIKKYGKDNFTFKIIELYKTRGGLYYAEAYAQMLCEVMTAKKKLPLNGVKGIPVSYNRQIAAIRFIPPEEPTKRTKSCINKLRKKYL
jgi:hypothetical protein